MKNIAVSFSMDVSEADEGDGPGVTMLGSAHGLVTLPEELLEREEFRRFFGWLLLNSQRLAVNEALKKLGKDELKAEQLVLRG